MPESAGALQHRGDAGAVQRAGKARLDALAGHSPRARVAARVLDRYARQRERLGPPRERYRERRAAFELDAGIGLERALRRPGNAPRCEAQRRSGLEPRRDCAALERPTDDSPAVPSAIATRTEESFKATLRHARPCVEHGD